MKKIVFLFSLFYFSFFIDSSAQIINTIAGDGIGGDSGDGGPAIAAEIYAESVTVDRHGNTYISGGYSNVWKVNASGIISNFAGNGIGGYSGDGGPATAAELGSSLSIAADDSGNIYIPDDINVRKVNILGIITTLAGNGISGYSGDGGPATAAEIGGPLGIGADDSGNIYIADFAYNIIRKVNTSGIISTFAGNGYAHTGGGGGFTGDGGYATAAELNNPTGVAVDKSGNVFIADYGNDRIRKVNISGIISTFAGDSAYGFSGDGGQATAAELGYTEGVAVDDSGNVFIADDNNNSIRKVNTSGIISTFAGNEYNANTGNGGFSGDGGNATAAELDTPNGVAADGYGNIYIADIGNARIRKVTYHTNTFTGNKISPNGEELRVYPNPNNGIFTISLGHPELVSGSQTRIEIYNVFGEQVLVETLRPVQPARTGTGGGDNLINLSDKPDGIYLYRVLSEKGKLEGEGKIIIDR